MENQNYNISDPKDVEMEAAISRTVRNMGERIHVSSHGGHVTLSGTVDDFSSKREIVSAARNVSGVREVINHIRVAPVIG